MQFEIESGDQELQKHFENAKKNALNTSPQIQNENIDLCSAMIRGHINNMIL